MIKHERTDIFKEIDFKKTHKSVECMICHYWYFKDIGFKYQPYVCNNCHNVSLVVQNLDDFVILKVHGFDYRCYIVNVSKKVLHSLLKRSVLDDKRIL